MASHGQKGGTQKKNRFYLFKYEHPQENEANELNEPPPLKTSRYNPDAVSNYAYGQFMKLHQVDLSYRSMVVRLLW